MLVSDEPAKIVDVSLGLFHAIAGICLAFFVMYRGFYGAVLGGPCWLFYKVLEGVFIAICIIISVHLCSEFVFESARYTNII